MRGISTLKATAVCAAVRLQALYGPLGADRASPPELSEKRRAIVKLPVRCKSLYVWAADATEQTDGLAHDPACSFTGLKGLGGAL
jgi:hypothetical protein